MHPLLSEFAQSARNALLKDPGPIGRSEVCVALSSLLRNEEFLREVVDANPDERFKAYEDADLGFCVLVHYYAGAKSSPPHDHAHSWAIYGQARGTTYMTDYALVEKPNSANPGKVKPTRSYHLSPGDVYLYNEGDLHSPKRKDSTRLIRIEGVDMKTVSRSAFEVV
jgi:hypothetical protein